MISNFTDHASNERTFLAWVRTSIGVVGFGLAASRLGGNAGAAVTELMLLFSGALVIVVAFWRMRHLRRLIDASGEMDGGLRTADALLLLLVVALFLMLGMFAVHVG